MRFIDSSDSYVSVFPVVEPRQISPEFFLQDEQVRSAAGAGASKKRNNLFGFFKRSN